MKPKMSLSREWAALSEAMYGQDFIDELADFFKQNNVHAILECGCGDGHVLKGLAEKGFFGIGVDIDEEMIDMAKDINEYQTVRYFLEDWQKLDASFSDYDAVMCRGNSLSSATAWGNYAEINPKTARKAIENSIGLFFDKIRKGGLLYLDTTSQREIDEVTLNRGVVRREIDFPEIHLKGKIYHDWTTRTRLIAGKGTVYGQEFKGKTYSYLMKPAELEDMIKQIHPTARIFHPTLPHEINYDVICAVK